MAALTDTRHNPEPQRVFLRLKAAGKSHNGAAVTHMRKLIFLPNVHLRDDRPWAEAPPAGRAWPPSACR